MLIKKKLPKEEVKQNLTIRVSKLDREEIKKEADKSGLAITTYIRFKALNLDVDADKKRKVFSNINRSLNLLKHLKDVKYVETAAVEKLQQLRFDLQELKEEIRRLK